MIGPTPLTANRFSFRAWHYADGEMHSNVIIAPDGWVHYEAPTPNDPMAGVGLGDNGIDCVVMQSTGLLDKNGKEIFCGDVIMQTYDFDESTLEYKLKDNLYVVDFGMYEKKFHCCINDSDDCTCMNDTTFGILLKKPNARPFPLVFGHDVEYEIIGNIYENPELLK